MRAELLWSIAAGTQPVYSLSKVPDSSKIYGCSGEKVTMFSTTGQVVKTIATQHTAITQIAAAPDGQRISTVGLDTTVMFFDTNGAALFKYTHGTEVQCCAFSPDGHWFISAAGGDLGIFKSSEGSTKVNKYKVSGLVRALAWSPSSAWFAIITEEGELILMDTDGYEFNRCTLGSPTWAIKIVSKSIFTSKTDLDEFSDNSDSTDEYIVKDIPSATDQSAGRKRVGSAKQIREAETAEFVHTHSIDQERILVASWDMHYRVLNPACTNHGGSIVSKRGVRSARRKSISESAQLQETSFICADAALDFIPLCMEVVGNYILLSGVGGTVSAHNARNGRKLIDLYQVWETDRSVYNAPQNVAEAGGMPEGSILPGSVDASTDPAAHEAAHHRSYSDTKLVSERPETMVLTNALAYYGLHTIWCYSILAAGPSYVMLGLSNGAILCLNLRYHTVHSVYDSMYAIRGGLTSVMVRNLATDSSSIIESGAYVKKLAIYHDKLAILTDTSLDIYMLTDIATQRRTVESVLQNKHVDTGSAIRYQRLVTIPKRYTCNTMMLASESFILCRDKRIIAYNFSGKVTDKWEFRRTFITFVKLFGGPPKQEGIVVGCADGKVLLLKLGNRFPIEAISHESAISSVDISGDRRFISVIDSRNYLSIYSYFNDDSIIYGTGSMGAPPASEFFNGAPTQLQGNAVLGGFTGEHRDHNSEFDAPLFVFRNAIACTWDLLLSGVFVVSTGKSIDVCNNGSIIYSFQTPSTGSFSICQNGHVSFVFNAAMSGLSLYDASKEDILERSEIPMTPKVSFHIRNIYKHIAVVTEMRALNGDEASGDQQSRSSSSPEMIATAGDQMRLSEEAEFYARVDPAKDLNDAIKAAYLGIPVDFWRSIATASLFANEIECAREALATVGDVRVLKTIAEILRVKEAGGRTHALMFSALALSLVGHFSEASLLYAACGSIDVATELLFFVPRDGRAEQGDNASIISEIAANLIKIEVKRMGKQFLDILRVMPSASAYARLGVSEGDSARQQRQASLDIQNTALLSRESRQMGRFLEFLDKYDSPSVSGKNGSVFGNSYTSDYRIILRRQISTFAATPAVRNEILLKHAKFLEASLEWQAASVSYLDADSPERAVDVLISNRQSATLLKLVRALPPLASAAGAGGGFEGDQFDSDFGSEQAGANDGEARVAGAGVGLHTGLRVSASVRNTPLYRAFAHVLVYFEGAGDYEAAIFVAQRLGNAVALLRILVSQGMWDQVERLGDAYPEMRASIHEARANAFLREGRFMEALARLRLSGNREKEVAIIRNLITASTIELRFLTARALTEQLVAQIGKMPTYRGLFPDREMYHVAVKSLKARILVYSAYQHVKDFLHKVLRCPDPNDMSLMKIPYGPVVQRRMIHVGVFLTSFASLPPEITTADVAFDNEINKEDVLFSPAQPDSPQGAEESGSSRANRYATLVQSSTKPRLGSLASLDLGTGSVKALPHGISETSIWLALAIAASTHDADIERRTLKKLIDTRIPVGLANFVRKRLMQVNHTAGKGARRGGEDCEAMSTQTGQSAADACARCGAHFVAMPPARTLTQRDMSIVATLPHCCPVQSDICRACGSPAVRSVLSLRILPLVLVEHDPDESSILEAIEKISTVSIDLEAPAVNRLRVEDEYLVGNSRGLTEALRTSSVPGDGRGVILPTEVFEEVTPTNAFIVDDPLADPRALPDLVVDGVVRRIFVQTSPDIGIHYCDGCGFFFDETEYEESVILTGKCPICSRDDVPL